MTQKYDEDQQQQFQHAFQQLSLTIQDKKAAAAPHTPRSPRHAPRAASPSPPRRQWPLHPSKSMPLRSNGLPSTSFANIPWSAWSLAQYDASSKPCTPVLMPFDDSTTSSRCSSDSIPSMPSTISSILNQHEKRMHRTPSNGTASLPSSSSSSASFYSNKSPSRMHLPSARPPSTQLWDWTIEEHNLADHDPHCHPGKPTNSLTLTHLESMERDKYGFKKPFQWIDIKRLRQLEHEYDDICRHQQQKWDQLLLEHDQQWPPMSSRVKKYIRKGIPSCYRGDAWMHYSGAKAKMDAHPGMYETLLETALTMGHHNEHAEVIERDLHRTFPDNTHFMCARTDADGHVHMEPDTNPKLVSLKHILYAFSVHSPEIGYCQSLNYLVGIFLMMTRTDEEAFWLLVTLVHDYCPENMYDITMEGSTIEQMILMDIVYEKMPGIWNKLANGKCFWECEQADAMPPITLVTNHWFLTLFVNILPIETVLRIWDCFFVEGYKVLYRVSMTIIKMNEPRIWTLDDPIEVFPLLQKMPRRIVDCHRFMERVFAKSSVSADITMQEIERKRRLFRDRRKQRRHKKFKQFIESQA